MLAYLHIKNIALIEEAEIHFNDGLNILTGETGAGKSMVIDSINFAMGERSGKDLLRKGEEQALVEVLFDMKGNAFQERLAEMGIPLEEDGSVLITRSVSASGRTVNRINGSTVTAGMLRKLSELFIDIHGQHEHQSLLNPSRHILLLDQFCGKEMEEEKEKLSVLYRDYKNILREMEALSGNEQERARKLDLLRFQAEEIEEAALQKDEEEALNEEKKRIANGEKLNRLSNGAIGLLYEGDGEGSSAYDKIGEALHFMEELCRVDKALEPVRDELEGVYAQLSDASRELSRYISAMDTEPRDINEIEERLNLIYNLKRKYGNSVEEILRYLEKVRQEIDIIENSEEKTAALEKEKNSLQAKIAGICAEMTGLRHEKAMIIQKDIEEQLKDLEMKNARFEIRVDRKEEFTANGWDRVEFLISANRGEELKPLAKIASGGEMSRVMLALKTVLACADEIETFIFDEIDTGISGRTAQKVAEKMSLISGGNQIICITHLAQIAAMADSHYLIEKKAAGEKTITNVFCLGQKDMEEELARLMGGAEITPTTRRAARELKDMADVYKKQNRL